jgi:hypothetical protein
MLFCVAKKFRTGQEMHLSDTAKILLTTLGTVFLLLGFYPFFKALSSERWSYTDGEVIRSYATHEVWKEASIEFPYRAVIEYRYAVDGREYTSQRVEFGMGASLFFVHDFADRMQRRYPVGKLVRVYFDPAEPWLPVLERSPSMGTSVAWVLPGIVCTAVGLFANLFGPQPALPGYPVPATRRSCLFRRVRTTSGPDQSAATVGAMVRGLLARRRHVVRP